MRLSLLVALLLLVAPAAWAGQSSGNFGVSVVVLQAPQPGEAPPLEQLPAALGTPIGKNETSQVAAFYFPGAQGREDVAEIFTREGWNVSPQERGGLGVWRGSAFFSLTIDQVEPDKIRMIARSQDAARN